jgi:hypothetical protein
LFCRRHFLLSSFLEQIYIRARLLRLDLLRANVSGQGFPF